MRAPNRSPASKRPWGPADAAATRSPIGLAVSASQGQAREMRFSRCAARRHRMRPATVDASEEARSAGRGPPQQCLKRLPLPQAQGALRTGIGISPLSARGRLVPTVKIVGPLPRTQGTMQPDRTALLIRLMRERILILDGAMGTMIQHYKLSEADYRGERFHDHSHDLKGNNDLLVADAAARSSARSTTQYLEAGADIIETNTFNSTSIAQADYGMESGRVRAEPRGGAGSRARRPTRSRRATPRRPRFVAGALGPDQPHRLDLARRERSRASATSPSTSWSTPTREAVRGLVDGGVDLLLVETIFDTLNAKAALFAIDAATSRRPAQRLPIMISGTITDASGPHALGPDARSVLELGAPRAAALDRAQLRARREADAAVHRGARAHRRHLRLARTRTRACRTRCAETGYDETPEQTACLLARVRAERLPQHRRRLLRHDARAHQGDRRGAAAASRRARCRRSSTALRLSGLEPLNIGDDSLFVNIGERTNVTGSHGLRAADPGRRLRRGAVGRAPAGRERRADDRRQHGRGDARLEGGDDDAS